MTIHLLMKSNIRGSDNTIHRIRIRFWLLLSFFIYHSINIFIASIPIILVNISKYDRPLNWLDYIGWSIWFCGFLIETISDKQKLNFYSKPKEIRGDFIKTGIWYYSRHPNYYAILIQRFGIYLSSCNVFIFEENYIRFDIIIHFFSFPIDYIMSLIRFVFLITPLVEHKFNEKNICSERYNEYRDNTSPLKICPPKLYKITPKFLKIIFFHDYHSLIFSKILFKKLIINNK